MSVVNTRDRTINTKIVYYGPALGGKTTSLKHLHTTLDPQGNVRFISLKTDDERTVFFDLLPIDLGDFDKFRFKISTYTVPGQVKYNLTRRHVLAGADAVVFVADSQRGRVAENVQVLASLFDNLEANGLDAGQIPIVFQYNKRDVPDVASVEELEAALNQISAPHFESEATTGRGVFPAFVAAARSMFDLIAHRYGLASGQVGIGELAARHLVAMDRV